MLRADWSAIWIIIFSQLACFTPAPLSEEARLHCYYHREHCGQAWSPTQDVVWEKAQGAAFPVSAVVGEERPMVLMLVSVSCERGFFFHIQPGLQSCWSVKDWWWKRFPARPPQARFYEWVATEEQHRAFLLSGQVVAREPHFRFQYKGFLQYPVCLVGRHGRWELAGYSFDASFQACTKRVAAYLANQ